MRTSMEHSQENRLGTARWAWMATFAAGLAGFSTGGCPDATRNDFQTTVVEVDRIVADAVLTPQERREQLTEQGLSASAINAVLRDERLANQFGGTVTSAFIKVVDGFFQDLSPDEIQLYGDEATAVDAEVNAGLSDTQAQAVQTFFDENNIDNTAELAALLEDPVAAGEVPSAISDGVLTRLFVDFDPELLRTRLP